MNNKGCGGAIFIDLSIAFDTLNTVLLIEKLHAYGFQHDGLKFLHSYLSTITHKMFGTNSSFHVK